MEKMSCKTGRNILLAVTGGISAYKCPSLVREFIKGGFQVKTVVTVEAEKFVSPMVLSVLSGERSWRQEDYLSEEYGWEIPHIKLARWADAVVIAPATAETISRASRGEALTLIGSILLATDSPVLFFPSMNDRMYDHKATQANMSLLGDMGYYVFKPESGYLACGYDAKGRLPENNSIVEELKRVLYPSKDLKGKKVLVTAGPTREFLDPVRFLSNPSTGKMGLAMARNAWYRGANITLVHGPVSGLNKHGLKCVEIISAQQMHLKVMSQIDNADYIVKAAAVSDYRPTRVETSKIKKGEDNTSELNIQFETNPDIAFDIGQKKRKDQVLIGFAAESDNIIRNAKGKLEKKNMDFIVANDITSTDSGFASDTNRVKLIDKYENSMVIQGSKDEVADTIWNRVIESANYKDRP